MFNGGKEGGKGIRVEVTTDRQRAKWVVVIPVEGLDGRTLQIFFGVVPSEGTVGVERQDVFLQLFEVMSGGCEDGVNLLLCSH